jgi:hypothetical protein
MQHMSFYCRSYCLLSMFWAPLCPSSGAREYYTSGCCLSYLVLGYQVVGIACSCGLYVQFAGCYSNPQTGRITLSSTPYRQLENQAPNMTDSNHLYNTLELLMMGIMVPETCWASNKICNKNSSVASSWDFISTYYRRCTVKTTSDVKHMFVWKFWPRESATCSPQKCVINKKHK